MADDKIALGIVGASARAGWAMRAHLPALLALPEYDLVAVATANQDTANQSAEKYGARKAYGDYKDLVADPEIELVDVSVRAPNHHAIVMAALEAGKHVFCEWPLGANSAQTTEMADLAEKQNVRTLVGLQARYAPSFQQFKRLVDQGYLGRVLSTNMTMFLPGILRPRPEAGTWSADKEAGAHALNIATGHALDVFLWCLGDIVELSAEVTTQVPEWAIVGTDRAVDVTSPDTVALTGRLVNGAIVSVHVASIPHHGSAFRMEAYGTEGTLVASSNQMVEMINPVLTGGASGDPGLQPIAPPDDLRWVPADVPEGVPVNVAQMFRRFAAGIKDGSPVHPDFAEAARRHRLLDAIERSASERGWVTVSN